MDLIYVFTIVGLGFIAARDFAIFDVMHTIDDDILPQLPSGMRMNPRYWHLWTVKQWTAWAKKNAPLVER